MIYFRPIAPIHSVFSAWEQATPNLGAHSGRMLLTRRRHHPRRLVAAATPVPATPVTDVFVADGLSSVVQSLRALLPESFHLRTGQPGGDGVALLRPQGVASLAYWRFKFPGSVLIVVAPADQAHDAAAYLDAGADYFVTDAVPKVLGAYITAASRRAGGPS